jgi:hypothetical protein
VQYLVDTGEIQEHEMESHPAKNRILRALGTEETVKPDICKAPVVIQGGESFLMCSDGLNGMITGREIDGILSQRATGKSLEQRLDALIEAALNAGGKDNVTVGLLDFSGEFAAHPIVASAPRQGGVVARHGKMIAVVAFSVLLLLLGWFWFRIKEQDSSIPAEPGTEVNPTDAVQSPTHIEAGGEVDDSKPLNSGQTTTDNKAGGTSSGAGGMNGQKKQDEEQEGKQEEKKEEKQEEKKEEKKDEKKAEKTAETKDEKKDEKNATQSDKAPEERHQR